MELVLRDEKNELCIEHQSGSIGFTVLMSDGSQLDFNVDQRGWTQLKTFIDDSIYEYENSKSKTGKA